MNGHTTDPPEEVTVRHETMAILTGMSNAISKILEHQEKMLTMLEQNAEIVKNLIDRMRIVENIVDELDIPHRR